MPYNARQSIKHAAAIPAEMRALPNWVNWEFIERDGRQTKRPVNPSSLTSGAKANDAGTWGSFRQAITNAAGSTHLGVGFQFSNSPFVFIDLDWKGYEGEGYPPVAMKIMEWFSSYTEISPSGKGCHIIVEADLPEGYRSRGNVPNSGVEIEVYAEGRFSTITGDIIEHPFIENKQEELHGFLDYFLKKPLPPTPTLPTRVASSDHLDLSTNDLISRALDSNNNGFAQLYHGDISAYGNDHSRADSALIQHLIWWTNGDTQKVDEIFRASSLYRPKWDTKHHSDGRTYGQGTIERSMAIWDGQGYSGERKEGDRTDVVSRYKEAADIIREQGMNIIALASGHHHVKTAMRNTWFALCNHLQDGNIGHCEDGYYISFGGISTLCGLLGASRDQDVRNRLQYMAELGFFKFLKRVSSDPFAPVGAFISEYPEDLGIMRLLDAEIKGLDLKAARAPRISKIETIKQHTEEPKQRVEKARLPHLRATAYYIKDGATLEQLEHRTGLQRPTIKRHLEALIMLGLVAESNQSYVAIHDFEQAARLEREYLPSYRNGIIKRLEKTIAWVSRSLQSTKDAARLQSRRETLKLAQDRLDAIMAGEMISNVMSRAA